MIDLAGRPWLAEGTQMLAAIRRSDASHGEVAITRYATGEPVRLEYWAVPVHDNGVTGEMRCPRQRKMTCTGTPSGSSTDDRAKGLLAELEGGPDGNHRWA
jgi:hypothetical protein